MTPSIGGLTRLSILTGAAAALALSFGGVSQAADTGPMATVKAFIAAFNTGDMAAAQATNTDDVSIIDEIPPHAWHGPGAFQAWLGDLAADSKANDQSHQKVTFLRTTRSRIDGDTAYVIIAVTYTYKEHGHAMVEPAQIDMSLKNGDGGWKVNSWAWVGTAPRRAIAAAKPAPAAPAAPKAP
jgi:ketosteroid isomerase-like protein